MKTGRFPTGDEPAEQDDDAPASVCAGAGDAARVVASPARAARETAARIAGTFDIEPAFGDIDYGRWRGHSIREIGEREPEHVAAWLGDPQARPHDGESVGMLAARVTEGIARIAREMPDGRCIVVTHAIVVKAAVAHALGQPLSSVYAMDFAPLSSTVLRTPSGMQTWTVELPHPRA